MTAPTRHQAREKLLAQVGLTERRLRALADQLEQLDDAVRTDFDEEVALLDQQCRDLKAEIASWTEVEIGIPTAMEDLGSAVDAIEADLDALDAAEPSRYELAIDRQVRTWKGRMDWLRLQGALGAMEARDDVIDLTHRLDNVRGDVLVELQNVADDSKEVVSDLRRDVEKVLVDVRQVVRKAATGLTPR